MCITICVVKMYVQLPAGEAASSSKEMRLCEVKYVLTMTEGQTAQNITRTVTDNVRVVFVNLGLLWCTHRQVLCAGGVSTLSVLRS